MINKVILVGNLGADPEVRYTQGGTPVANFNLATSESWRNQNGDKEEHTEWHKIVVWRKLAEICGEYLKKGSKIYLEGRIRTRKWQDKDGNDRYTSEIEARDIQFLSTRSSDTNSDQPSPDQEPPPGVGDDVPF